MVACMATARVIPVRHKFRKANTGKLHVLGKQLITFSKNSTLTSLMRGSVHGGNLLQSIQHIDDIDFCKILLWFTSHEGLVMLGTFQKLMADV